MTTQMFPKELLDSLVEKRVDYFVNYTMTHPILEQVAKKLLLTLYQAGGPSLIFLLGSTGVGKTTLLRFIVQSVYKKALNKMKSDKGYIPIAGIISVSPEFSQFDWQDFYIRGLRALQEPLIGYKTNRDRRFAFEDALQNRHSDYFYIDEAQEFRKVPSGRKLRDQTDCLKSISNISKVKFLLVGTYEAETLLDQSDQLTRRSVNIHFPRYTIKNEKEIKTFKGLINSLTCHLPLAEQSDLTSHYDYIYERSLGCFGIMKDWFSRTLGAVLENDNMAHTITLNDLEQHAMSPKKCLTILTAIKKGEETFSETQDQLANLQRGLEVYRNKVDDVTNSVSTKKQQQKKGVGKPNPRHYKLKEEEICEEEK